jgi:hypothetical protein
VLFVGRRGFDGHRALLEFADEIHEALLLALGIGLVLFAQARGQQRTDAAADQKVRDEVALEQAHGKGSHRLVACAGVRGRNTGSRIRNSANAASGASSSCNGVSR